MEGSHEKADTKAVLNINLGWKFHLVMNQGMAEGFDDGNGLY